MKSEVSETLGRYPLLTQMVIFDLCFFEPCLRQVSELLEQSEAEQRMAARMMEHHALRKLRAVYRGWTVLADHRYDDSHEMVRRVLSPELIRLADAVLGANSVVAHDG